MKIEIDRKSGFCFGVINAIRKAEDELSKKEQLYCLGDIVHNDAEISRLNKLGMISISHNEYRQMNNCKVLIRAHGEPPETYEYAKTNNITLIDATCPVVLLLQKHVKTAFRNIAGVNGQLVFFGKPGHAETVGINGQINNQAILISSKDELDKIDFDKPVELYSQTTMPIEEFDELSSLIRQRAGENGKVNITDTICRQVANRGPHLREFAEKFDVIIFVAGFKSSNGSALYKIAKSINPNTFWIETPACLDARMFSGAETAGICGATSTPRWLMEDVAEWIRENT